MNKRPQLVLPMVVYPDVVGLLTMDHRKVQALFAEIQAKRGRIRVHEKFELVRKVCAELLIHFAVEEGIFYPAVREAIEDVRLMDEAEDEHESAKSIIIMLGSIPPDDPMFDAKVRALAEQIEHHIQDEEAVMFPKVLVSELDLVAVGRELLAAKNEMRARLGLAIEEIADEHFPEEDMYLSSSHARNAASRMRHI
ncbi:hemerythrin HHE cation binding domain-containing protein [Paucimonas lemoignei]|uniref:Hemerythrin HHE cation binding domain-containing protein n=1 Tax=Paucimonas lemoignei TaxID=29443 RepID=A0A4R3HSK8_PAULE|nr:hemerythrin domain-containing protein [Paucimonas lemoignei]TCS36002.1 hemerythrin HHE cation binding domain-containing protein [Paucimonas lemoignei]